MRTTGRTRWDSRVSSFKTAFDDVLHEIAIMRKMSHPNVMALKDVIDDATVNKLYMVMDYCPHGAIMDSHQMPVEPIPHDKCRKWFTDAVIGLDYLHFQARAQQQQQLNNDQLIKPAIITSRTLFTSTSSRTTSSSPRTAARFSLTSAYRE